MYRSVLTDLILVVESELPGVLAACELAGVEVHAVGAAEGEGGALGARVQALTHTGPPPVRAAAEEQGRKY